MKSMKWGEEDSLLKWDHRQNADATRNFQTASVRDRGVGILSIIQKILKAGLSDGQISIHGVGEGKPAREGEEETTGGDS